MDSTACANASAPSAARSRWSPTRMVARCCAPPSRSPPDKDSMIRILLAEDQAMVRGALGALLMLERDIEVLGAVSDGMQALSECRRLKPDIVVTDIEMPGMTGIELAQGIQAEELPIKVVIVTTFARQGYLRRALDA